VNFSLPVAARFCRVKLFSSSIAVIATCVALLGQPASGAYTNDVHANDNSHSAGQLTRGVLMLRLEIREGRWNPEGENGPQIPVQAFGEEGRPLTNPGPLIRVSMGARVRISAHSLLRSQSVVIHGLSSHTGASETLTIKPLGTEEVEFRAVRPGVYFYWGTTTGASLDKRTGVDNQLSGALIVDPPGAGAIPDRIFVLGHWDQEGDAKSIPPKPELEPSVIMASRGRIPNGSFTR
jgi:FtsP/CotA-like multicopper oxidase with cupredoxin domain